MNGWTAIALYLLLGGVALLAFDLATRRIRRKLEPAVEESQHRVAEAGTFVGHRTMTVAFLAVMWIFWPAVFVGAALPEKKENK